MVTSTKEEPEGSNKNTSIEQFGTEDYGGDTIESTIASEPTISILLPISSFVLMLGANIEN